MSSRVVVALPESENEFQAMQAADARSTAGRLGLEVEVAFADHSPVQQIQQIFKLLNADPSPKAVVVEPVALEGMERMARKAVTGGVGWSMLNCTAGFLEALRREAPGVAAFAVGSDQVEIGRLQGRQIRILLPAGGTVLYVQGPPTATAVRERRQGMLEALQGTGIETIVLDAQWSEDSAEGAVRQWLRLKTSDSARVDLVAAQDDAMARGARRVVEAAPDAEARWAGVPFLGIDGVPQVGQKLVQSGLLTATVVMPSNTGPALEAIARWLESGQMPPALVRLPVRSYPDENALRPRAEKR